MVMQRKLHLARHMILYPHDGLTNKQYTSHWVQSHSAKCVTTPNPPSHSQGETNQIVSNCALSEHVLFVQGISRNKHSFVKISALHAYIILQRVLFAARKPSSNLKSLIVPCVLIRSAGTALYCNQAHQHWLRPRKIAKPTDYCLLRCVRLVKLMLPQHCLIVSFSFWSTNGIHVPRKSFPANTKTWTKSQVQFTNTN